MNHTYTKNEADYLDSFKNLTLDLSKFHHKEHLLVTYVLLIDNNIEDTYSCIKNTILSILKKVGADINKYHETMTYAWILLVQNLMEVTKKCDNFEHFLSLNQNLLDIDSLYKYYPKELIHNPKARTEILIK